MARYEIIGAVFVAGFSVPLAVLLVREAREHRPLGRSGAIRGTPPLVSFRYGPDQWRRVLRLEMGRHVRLLVFLAASFALITLAGTFLLGALEGSVATFVQENGGWVCASVAAGAGWRCSSSFTEPPATTFFVGFSRLQGARWSPSIRRASSSPALPWRGTAATFGSSR
ncbi:MAG TPA: hypothetical protein VEB43_16110 [Anaeromyxobacter sp.]|nr:hypothetical protein [Anaeromyxobacter sp.]